MEKVTKVVQALKVLQDEGREDLLQDGVLEHAWVDLRRLKRMSSEGVAVAVMACASPTHTPKIFRQQSISGRKVKLSPERLAFLAWWGQLVYRLMQVKRGGVRTPARREGETRSGSSDIGDAFGLGFQEVHQVVQRQPSTSQGAGFVEQEYELEEEVLDYDDEDEAQDGESVQQRAVQKGVSDDLKANGRKRLGILQETTKKAVRSDR
ncbi:hypothetical protein NDU88_006695 [Pleurodeles waltl]|uniref:Uncharacterized protein n=1 Tax=Pleurodeles waltl TaxID=8319 RepID=A0AAV7RQ78_PLEWA|nr:hypothetical protein NDU88_006695 [Pleurodeles waltl]